MRRITRRQSHQLFVSFLWVVLLPPSLARAQEYHVDTSAENQVTFISDAPIEDFEGVTSAIDGYVLLGPGGLDPNADLESSQFYFEVDLATIHTGIKRRDRHMRENYLETAKFPYASYEGKLSGTEADDDGSFHLDLEGTFSVHGEEREKEVKCVARGGEARYRIRCRFEVSLVEHDIDVPSLMFLKIGEVIDLRVDFYVKRVQQ